MSERETAGAEPHAREAPSPGSEAWLRELVDSLPSWLWAAESDGTVQYLSAPGLAYFGLRDATLRSWTWASALHPDDAEFHAPVIAEAFAQQKDLDVLARFRSVEGDYAWLRVCGTIVRDSDGRVIRWAGSAGAAADIVRWRNAEQEARKMYERLVLALQGSRIGIWEYELPDGALSPATAATFHNIWEPLGYDATDRKSDFLDVHRSITHPDDAAVSRAGVEAFLQSTATHRQHELRLIRKDGAIRWHLVRSLAVRDENGRPTRLIGVQADITELKEAEAALREAQASAEAASRAKDEFLANVSHEIRTPMNAILGMTELTLDSVLTEHQRTLLKTVKSAADSLLVIINDLLDFSKIEAGKLDLESVPFSLRSTVGETMRALATRAHRKGVELVIDVQATVPDALIGDPGRLRQVLLNVVGNAIKFTEDGEVVVTVSLDSSHVQGDRAAALRVDVRDTGIGISPDKQAKIFRAFEQEDTSTTRRFGGTGLGLSIAAHLVSLMGGEISVESQRGRGSTFSLRAHFALETDAVDTAVELPLEVLRDLRVLVVDDNPTNRHILEEWLLRWHMTPSAVGDGLTAMGALWDAAACDAPFEVVLLDSRMPDTDGWALAARIRERPALVALRIVMLASADHPGDPARSRELDIDAHLLKPVLQEELLETIHRVISHPGGPKRAVVTAPRSAGARATFGAPVRVLVAEDNELSAQLMVELLTGRGYRVRVAKNGRDAAALAEQGAFDILFLDLHMPILDGFEVARVVRDRERTHGGHLPIVALTARSRSEDRARSLDAGMDDFLAKPIRSNELFAAIDRLVRLSRQGSTD